MVIDENSDDASKELQKQVETLQQQLTLLNAQMALEIANRTQQSQLAKATSEAIKEQLSSQFGAESERAKLPFAELAGIKAALGDMKLPEGKSGTIQIGAGTAGTALLRSKKQMLELLDHVADEINAGLPDGAVIVSNAQLDQAYQCRFMLKTIEEQTERLINATKQAMPKTIAPSMALAPIVAGAYSAGLVMDTINSLAKLFRVDRKVDVFAADTEAKEILAYLLEGKNPKFITNPAVMSNIIEDEAGKLIGSLSGLIEAIQRARDTLEQIKSNEDEGIAVSADTISSLKSKADEADTLVKGLHPAQKPDEFWAQVKGQLISRALEGKKRLIFEVKAQAVQITESRWWRSDRLCTSGEVQVMYRILNEDEKIEKNRIVLKASKVEKSAFLNVVESAFPNKKQGTQGG